MAKYLILIYGQESAAVPTPCRVAHGQIELREDDGGIAVHIAARAGSRRSRGDPCLEPCTTSWRDPPSP
jgi:hypothetical protein